MFKTEEIQVNHIKLHTEYFGNISNPACLLISGAMASARFWTDAFCKYLMQQGFFVIRYDHRDIGESSAIDWKKEPYTIFDLAKDALGILDAFGIKKAHFVGHSMGGHICQALGVSFPKRILSLSIISSGPIGSTEETDIPLTQKEQKILDRTWKLLLAPKNENSLYLNNLKNLIFGFVKASGFKDRKWVHISNINPLTIFESRDLSLKPKTNFSNCLGIEEHILSFMPVWCYLNGKYPFDEEMAKDYTKDLLTRTHHKIQAGNNHELLMKDLVFSLEERRNILKKIHCPIHIIYGDQDPLALPRDGYAIANSILQAQLILISGMGHMIFNKDLQLLIGQILIEFFTKVSESIDCNVKRLNKKRAMF